LIQLLRSEDVRRYADNIDKYGGAGLTTYLAAAVRANAKPAPA
jgi:hypothetical protein